MISATIHLTVQGDSYDEIVTKALELLNTFFGEENIAKRAIEIDIQENNADGENEFSYVGYITAKARNVD